MNIGANTKSSKLVVAIKQLSELNFSIHKHLDSVVLKLNSIDDENNISTIIDDENNISTIIDDEKEEIITKLFMDSLNCEIASLGYVDKRIIEILNKFDNII